MKKHDTFFSFDANGNKVKYECLDLFRLDKYEKIYIVFTDNITDDVGRRKTYISAYYDDGNNFYLEAIHSLNEWKEVKQYISKISSI